MFRKEIIQVIWYYIGCPVVLFHLQLLKSHFHRMAAQCSNYLICQICSEPFTDPRMLPCLHSFCCQCLRNKVETQQSILCPTCLRSVHIPMGGVNGLPQNLRLGYEVEVAGYVSKLASHREVPCTFCVTGCTDPAVTFCSTCRQFMCTFGHMSHKRVKQFTQHKLVELGQESATQIAAMMEPSDHYCSQPKHMNEKMTLYCKTCSHPICKDCALDSHKEHNTTILSNTAQAHRDEMRGTLECAQNVLSALAEAIEANNKVIQQIESSKHDAKLAIEESFRQVIDSLEERKKKLLAELENTSVSKIASLTIQKKQFENIQQKMNHCTEVASHIVQTHTDHEVVVLGDLVSTELKATIKKAENISLTPNQRSHLQFSAVADGMLRDISEFGAIIDLTPSPPCSKYTVQHISIVKKKYEISVETMSSIGERYTHGGIVLKAELRPKLQGGAVVTGEVEDHGDGTYTITLTPQTAGRYELHITMDGQHIQNSPYDLKVERRNYTGLCNPSDVINVNGEPLCVAIHVNGDVYVGCNNGHIYVYDQCGQLKNTIGSRGSRNGQFCGPFGICIKGDVIYVADYANHRVQKLTTQGKFLDKFGTKGAGRGQFNRPWNVIVDKNDRVIVSEWNNHRVQIFNKFGVWLLTIGAGHGEQNIEYPRGLCIDPEGNIHVVCDKVIKVFTSEGTFIREYGDLKGPVGIAVDEEGYSFVSEGGCSCLSIFDSKGNKVHTVQSSSEVSGVALDSRHDNIYITNLDGRSVYKYTL